MPFLAGLAPLFSIIGAGAGAASAGLGIANAVSGGGSQQPSQPAPQTAAQNIAAEVAKRQSEGAMVANQTPNLVDQTSGSLTDQSYQTFGSQDTGNAGTFGQGGIDLNTIMQFLGGSGGGSPTNLTNLASGSITG